MSFVSLVREKYNRAGTWKKLFYFRGLFCCSLCFKIYIKFTVVSTFKHHLSCENRIQINNIVSRLHFLVFYSGFNFLSLNSFIIRCTCNCDEHLPEEAKSLETLVMKSVLGNASLDNGRIDIHPLTPRKLSCNLSGGLRSWRPLQFPLSKHKTRKPKKFTEWAMLLSQGLMGLAEKTTLSEPPLPAIVFGV